LHGASDHILNQTEILLHSLFLAVSTDFPVISRFCKWSCVVVHMHQGIRNVSSGFKNAIKTFFMVPLVTRNVTQNTRPSFCFSEWVWERD